MSRVYNVGNQVGDLCTNVEYSFLLLMFVVCGDIHIYLSDRTRPQMVNSSETAVTK